MPKDRIELAKAIFRLHNSTMATSDAIEAGIHPETLYKMRDHGTIEELDRGLFRLADEPAPSDPDLLVVARKVPAGVICLISALSFHELTTQIPHKVDIAIRRGIRPAKINHPPVRYYYFSQRSHESGVEVHRVNDEDVKVYSPEKTLADCFKFRNQIGLDVVLEALKFYKERRNMNVGKIIEYAKICRVKSVMLPYLEATI
jgi:predicted transcriptional regulator of viral defense system